MSKDKSTKDSVKNKDKKSQVKFSALYCAFFLTLTRIVSRFVLHCKWKKSKAFNAQLKKGPMLILSNHLSAYDFINFSAPLVGHKVNFVVAENMMFSTPIFAKLISSYHAIPKRQYFADFNCIKQIKKNLDAGISVVLCPEGKVSADGKTGAISESTARLIEWLGVPVGVCKLEGASFVRPKWAYNKRKGKNFASYDLLFSKEDVKNLSRKEIYERTVSALDHNEHKWQIETGTKFSGKRYAEGLDRILYVCPKCGKEFLQSTKDDEIFCRHCGNRVKYETTGRLVPQNDESVSFERIDIWFDRQRELVKEEVSAADFKLEDNVKLFVENETKNGYRYIADGRISLEKGELKFVAASDRRLKNVKAEFKVNNLACEETGGETEPVEEEFLNISFNVSKSDTIAYQPGTLIDMYDENHTYRFMFKDRFASTKYALCIEESFKLQEKNR